MRLRGSEEICRMMSLWTTCDAKIFGVKLPTDVPASIQERAYTTSILYTP
jgi:hypothetical protein